MMVVVEAVVDEEDMVEEEVCLLEIAIFMHEN